jgi:hypothetical protein
MHPVDAMRAAEFAVRSTASSNGAYAVIDCGQALRAAGVGTGVEHEAAPAPPVAAVSTQVVGTPPNVGTSGPTALPVTPPSSATSSGPAKPTVIRKTFKGGRMTIVLRRPSDRSLRLVVSTNGARHERAGFVRVVKQLSFTQRLSFRFVAAGGRISPAVAVCVPRKTRTTC